MWCKNCRKETDSQKCDVCGKVTIADVPFEVYWCDDCNVPLVIKATDGDRTLCPLCGSKIRYLTTDLRPVFPEERLLLELLFEKPLQYINSSVWASDNRYYIDGKVKTVSNTIFANADVSKLIEGLQEYREQNSYAVFEFYIEKFVNANIDRLRYIKSEAFDFIRNTAQDYPSEHVVISFSGGKDSTIEQKFNPKFDLLFTYDFPSSPAPDYSDINTFDFWGLNYIPSQDELRQAFR